MAVLGRAVAKMFWRRVACFFSWVAVNAIGVIFYLSGASRIWPRSGDINEPDSLGSAFYWFSHSVPLLVFFLMLNFGLVIALRKFAEKTTRSQGLVLFRFFVILWIAVVVFDYYKSN